MTSSVKPVLGVVTWDFLQSKGGMGLSAQWIAESLSTEWRVVVGTPVSSKRTIRHKKQNTRNNQDSRNEESKKYYENVPLLSFTKYFGGHLLFSLCLPFVLRQWIRKNHISALLIPGGPGGVFLLKIPRIPYICSVYHLYEQQARLVPGQWWKKIFLPFEKRTYAHAAGILSFNADAHRILQSVYGIPEDYIHLLPHAVDGWKGSAHPKKKGLCVCVARLEARKGVDLLVDAWHTVVGTIPDARLLIIGQGIGATAIDEKIRHMTGIVRIPSLLFADLVHVVQQAEVAVCPAYLEGFGLAAAEAMTTGTAVVASDSEGLRCLIDHRKTGLLHTAGDSAALADALITLLRDDSLRQTIASAAQTHALERFDPASASASLVCAVKDIVTDRL